jgi:uncharacterized protein YecE (DUF72 family)
MEALNQFFGGTSGLQTPIPKRDFPENFKDKSRLTYYGSLFNSIEINSSFYKIPLPLTVSKWSAEVDDNFRFTFKLWKGITHQPNLLFVPIDVETFMGVIDHIGEKSGCLLIQFPPGLSITGIGQLTHLLSLVTEYNDRWKLAVEFRHRSWYVDEVYQLLQSANASLVIHDLPASAAPLRETAEDFIYLRFHGPEGRYRGSYRDDFLYEYAGYINDWLQDGKTVYTYFNNTAGDALANLKTLKKQVALVTG